MPFEDEFHEDEMNDNGTLNAEEFEENNGEVLEESGIEDDVDVFDPDEFDEGDPDEEFDYLDGVDVPDPDNADEEEEANEDEFPDDEDGE